MTKWLFRRKWSNWATAQLAVPVWASPIMLALLFGIITLSVKMYCGLIVGAAERKAHLCERARGAELGNGPIGLIASYLPLV